MTMKPIKLKYLLEQAKNPETQHIEILEDYILSVKTVYEGMGTQRQKNAVLYLTVNACKSETH